MTPDNLSDADKNKKKSAMAGFAADLIAAEEEDKEAKKEIIREGVERIEKREGDSIMASRMVTSELAKLREEADMSPFVGTSGKITSPRFRRAEFIEILARELLWIGREELKDKGGIISLNQLRSYFAESRDNWELREKDIPEALQWLDDKEMIPDLDKLDDDLTLIHFRPIELTNDTRAVLKAGLGIDATKSSLKSILGWDMERLERTLQKLETEGIVIIDDDQVFFPGL